MFVVVNNCRVTCSAFRCLGLDPHSSLRLRFSVFACTVCLRKGLAASWQDFKTNPLWSDLMSPTKVAVELGMAHNIKLLEKCSKFNIIEYHNIHKTAFGPKGSHNLTSSQLAFSESDFGDSKWHTGQTDIFWEENGDFFLPMDLIRFFFINGSY